MIILPSGCKWRRISVRVSVCVFIWEEEGECLVRQGRARSTLEKFCWYSNTNKLSYCKWTSSFAGITYTGSLRETSHTAEAFVSWFNHVYTRGFTGIEMLPKKSHFQADIAMMVKVSRVNLSYVFLFVRLHDKCNVLRHCFQCVFASQVHCSHVWCCQCTLLWVYTWVEINVHVSFLFVCVHENVQ